MWHKSNPQGNNFTLEIFFEVYLRSRSKVMLKEQAGSVTLKELTERGNTHSLTLSCFVMQKQFEGLCCFESQSLLHLWGETKTSEMKKNTTTTAITTNWTEEIKLQAATTCWKLTQFSPKLNEILNALCWGNQSLFLCFIFVYLALKRTCNTKSFKRVRLFKILGSWENNDEL